MSESKQGPKTQPKPSTARPAAQPPQVSNEEIHSLITALDDPTDERYAYAEDELIMLGPQAVPFLIEALSDQQPWLRSYRAAEALGQIGDGRASRPLIAALRHPNSNVRWGVVRALAKVGDSRALLPLRRIARSDRAKTSWGESVASAGQIALNEMSSRSAMLRLSDPIKIAVLVAVALFALWLATDRVQAFRQAIDKPETAAIWGTQVVPVIPTVQPETSAEGDDNADIDGAETPTPTLDLANTTPTASAAITATVTSPTGNVRPQPNTNNDPITQVKQGDVVEIVERAGDWYRIQLPNGTGTGWIASSLVTPPTGPVPTASPEN